MLCTYLQRTFVPRNLQHINNQRTYTHRCNYSSIRIVLYKMNRLSFTFCSKHRLIYNTLFRDVDFGISNRPAGPMRCERLAGTRLLCRLFGTIKSYVRHTRTLESSARRRSYTIRPESPIFIFRSTCSFFHRARGRTISPKNLAVLAIILSSSR